jgi:hypothetical protein
LSKVPFIKFVEQFTAGEEAALAKFQAIANSVTRRFVKNAQFRQKLAQNGDLLRFFYLCKVLVKTWKFICYKKLQKSIAYLGEFGAIFMKNGAKLFGRYFSEKNEPNAKNIAQNGEISPNLVTLIVKSNVKLSICCDLRAAIYENIEAEEEEEIKKISLYRNRQNLETFTKL